MFFLPEASLAYDLSLGLGLLALDTAMTILVVDRVVERQDEKKRRNLSGLVEARTLEALDGLLADGLPQATRQINVRLLTVGRAELPLQVSQVDEDTLREAWAEAPVRTARTIGVALDRYGASLTQPLHVAIIEPKLAPSLVHLINCIDAVSIARAEIQEKPSEEAITELRGLFEEMLTAALQLRQEIEERWA
ncbi:MAG: hypothetical protein ACTHK6_10665 [Solirubrobacterales bacterium]